MRFVEEFAGMQAEKSAGSIEKFAGQTWYKIANVDSITRGISFGPTEP